MASQCTLLVGVKDSSIHGRVSLRHENFWSIEVCVGPFWWRPRRAISFLSFLVSRTLAASLPARIIAILFISFRDLYQTVTVVSKFADTDYANTLDSIPAGITTGTSSMSFVQVRYKQESFWPAAAVVPAVIKVNHSMSAIIFLD